MTGAPPYSSRSPTQQSRYVSYSPSRDRPYSGTEASPYQQQQQQQQHPPHTPPGYPSHAAVNRSPHYTHPTSPMNTTLPPLNGAEPSPAYHTGHSASNQAGYSLPRPYGSSMMSNSAHSPPSGMYNHTPSHTRPGSIGDTVSHSPKREPDLSLDSRSGNSMYASQPPMAREARASTPKESKPARATDPMSFASILSGPAEERPRKASVPPVVKASEQPPPPPPAAAPAPPPVSAPKPEGRVLESDKRRRHHHYDATYSDIAPKPVANGTGPVKSSVSVAPAKQRSAQLFTNSNLNKAFERLENLDKSDVESPGFEDDWQRYIVKGRKRAREAEALDSQKRKRRRTNFLGKLARVFERQAALGTERFARLHEAEVIEEVQQKEIIDEKERKKDMQRKRRRENTVRAEMEKIQAAQKKVSKMEDDAEKEKLQREIARSRKKIKHTKQVLETGIAPQEISEVAPLSPNLEGGTTGSFHTRDKASPNKKRPSRSGAATRPKKTKEQKQAEKDAAEAAYAAMEGEEPVAIAPKEGSRKATLKKETKAARSKEPTPAPVATFDTKGYAQLYEQIWRDMARKDIPKVARIKTSSLNTRQENLRKTAQLASKQARKWQERTNRSTKDTQARAKRTMREMMSFWKRNEREERDLRRMAEKQELELARKADADREANRQKRKLNFLISQTELYSHFIGRKIKTSEAEHSGDTTVAPVEDKAAAVKEPGNSLGVPDDVGDLSAKVTNFEDLDFDAEDDTALREAAMANAQNAVKQAQDRAKAFNEQENKMAAFDEGEMNFQNPTSLGDVEVAQPKLLNCQLKEYQLKGLNWLVNLYEQGINGILADEMGLGKTVQSISVMAYLAEVHNIWGPFLVIAPASTLHNWQQEITKFVPDIKVLPYWGSAKDRKVLRKFWDRKHITYTKQSEFHVLVTSYQLVVLDAQYFQKVKWQYMVLDEAQAIKSSQSSRWKNLLGFHCRNRLLLTGTPIQNNMQELWALLHFIMPTLFDSHDEFSEWFSKDIESHAQSNTKLNEDQLKRLHMILKPFMLRRIKKHVQKELGDKVEKDVFCDLTYRQRAYYASLRNRVSIIDLIEKAATGEDADSTTLMNLVMQFRKVCNHPDLFERADTSSPYSMCYFAESASFVRASLAVCYSTRSLVEYDLPRMLCNSAGRLDIPGSENARAGFEDKYLSHMMNVWAPDNMRESLVDDQAFSWLRFTDTSMGEASKVSHKGVFERALDRHGRENRLARLSVVYDDDTTNVNSLLPHSLFNIVDRNSRSELAEVGSSGCLRELLNVAQTVIDNEGISGFEPCGKACATAPPIMISCSSPSANTEAQNTFFNVRGRQALVGATSRGLDEEILTHKVNPLPYSYTPMLPKPGSTKRGYTNITVPSMRRFVTDSGKLAKLDELLRELKNGGHRVLLYFQMTRMIDLMEEYLTYRNYKYCRLDGSTKLEDRRDTVLDFQQRPDIFIFLLSTRAGGLGINLTAADTVIFYDSDWNPTIDSQAMDRAHRLGQTRQVTVYRLITRGTIEERIRKRALQKEEVQRVVISGGAGGGVDFNTRSRENRTKDIAMWLADDDEAKILEQKEKEAMNKGEEATAAPKKGKKAAPKKKRDVTLDDMYHEGEGHFEDLSARPSGTATPLSADVETPAAGPPGKGRRRGPGKGTSKRAKSAKERLQFIDGDD